MTLEEIRKKLSYGAQRPIKIEEVRDSNSHTVYIYDEYKGKRLGVTIGFNVALKVDTAKLVIDKLLSVAGETLFKPKKRNILKILREDLIHIETEVGFITYTSSNPDKFLMNHLNSYIKENNVKIGDDISEWFILYKEAKRPPIVEYVPKIAEKVEEIIKQKEELKSMFHTKPEE